MNADELKNITVQVPPDLLAKIDKKVKQLDLNRSQYFRRLVRENLQVAAQANGQTHPKLEEAA